MTGARRGRAEPPAAGRPAGPGPPGTPRAAVSRILARQLAAVPWDGPPRLFTIHLLDGRLVMRPVAVRRQAWEGRSPGEVIGRLAAGWTVSPPGPPPGELRGAAVVFNDRSAAGLPPPARGRRRAAARALVAVTLHGDPFGIIETRGAAPGRPVRVGPGWEVPRALGLLLAALPQAPGRRGPAGPPGIG